MNRRLVLAAVAIALLATLAGCSALSGGISDEQLDQEAEYDDLRDSEADVAIDLEDGSVIEDGEFRAVYDLNETEELSLYRSSLYRDEPLDINSVRYWYPNGTELTGSELTVEQGQSETTVQVPDGNGTLAFSGDAGRKTFQLPAFVEGSYVVTVPEGHRTSNFLFGDVSPNGYEREVIDDRERLSWADLENTISLRYYLTRDIPLFLGLVGTVAVLGGIGIGYYYRQVKQLRKQREKFGLDVDTDDDSDGGPPGFP
ncbi:DUF5803 family protein [Natrinema longum]|uniref:Uncharacterized protein n=1 Tax=Natrinema longum TaxID=370324 RepID=A0A8A2U8W9_9EURY|nr:DUF5803 family protein [Natrinema longum]MBZ6493852.1 hypothetical protein [Natrinema longum]QSW84812.1 hypothetical protein J0X27_15375 [Natrinema longum]